MRSAGRRRVGNLEMSYSSVGRDPVEPSTFLTGSHERSFEALDAIDMVLDLFVLRGKDVRETHVFPTQTVEVVVDCQLRGIPQCLDGAGFMRAELAAEVLDLDL